VIIDLVCSADMAQRRECSRKALKCWAFTCWIMRLEVRFRFEILINTAERKLAVQMAENLWDRLKRRSFATINEMALSLSYSM